MGLKFHKSTAPAAVDVAVVSVSSSRSLKEDKAGHWIVKAATQEGHRVVYHQVVKDDADLLRGTLIDLVASSGARVILVTGGTGLSDADVTIEATKPLLEKELTAFSVLFAQLSFDQIDSAAILSRATAGRIGRSLVFCMPGSLNACKLACQELIFPEIGHMVRHIDKG
ncbi:MAG: MogA/MoaB family molybdenum cofactor biosynthesis protein [Desulfobacterales bacterium]|nr:MogA/MoaB family molybdenum cofactor biosynthesis protein [Desulfobacterales bacterium]